MSTNRTLELAIRHRENDPRGRKSSVFELSILRLFRNDLGVHRQWKRFSCRYKGFHDKLDHDKILAALIESVELAHSVSTSTRLRVLTKLDTLLTDHYGAGYGCEQGFLAGSHDAVEMPSDVSDFVVNIKEAFNELRSLEKILLDRKITYPLRRARFTRDAAAREFEVRFSRFLAIEYGRPFDEVVLSLSRILFPASTTITYEMLHRNRKKYVEPHKGLQISRPQTRVARVPPPSKPSRALATFLTTVAKT